jgi:hypothetical protein
LLRNHKRTLRGPLLPWRSTGSITVVARFLFTVFGKFLSLR